MLLGLKSSLLIWVMAPVIFIRLTGEMRTMECNTVKAEHNDEVMGWMNSEG
jgi:hypothetical protein